MEITRYIGSFESKKTMKYILVGGNPFRMYTGTLTYTGLDVVAKSDSLEEIKKAFNDRYDDCGGLLMIIDTETGEPASVD